MKGAHATFQLSAIIREYGFHATRWTDDLDALAAAAGIGTLEARGRIDTPKFGTKVHVADVILTDLPVAVDRP
jgi:epoxyqueuosine reductase QueG